MVTVFPCPRLQDKRRRQNRFAAKEWASKLAESDKGSYYNQEKWLKDDKAPEKPIETTTELSFTSSLASGASFFGREAAKRETKLIPLIFGWTGLKFTMTPTFTKSFSFLIRVNILTF